MKVKLRKSGGHWRNSEVKATITIMRAPPTPGFPRDTTLFQACVSTNRGVVACGKKYDRNPRKAVARAFREAAKSISKRRGAFAGHRKHRRRRRR